MQSAKENLSDTNQVMIMYRQNSDYYIPRGTPKHLAKLIRHRRYADGKLHRITVPYYDNMLIVEEPVDYQRIAMRTALERMRQVHPQRYKVLYEFYFVECISVKEYAKRNGITFQAMYKKLDKCRAVLRRMSYEELEKLL